MCRSKEDGGRRCPSAHNDDSRIAHNDRRRTNRARRREVADRLREQVVGGDDLADEVMGMPPSQAVATAALYGVSIDTKPSGAGTFVDRANLLPAPGAPRDRWSVMSAAGPARTLMSDEDRLMRESQEWADSLSDEEREAIKDYTASDFDVINEGFYRFDGLDHFEREGMPEYVDTVARLDAALARAGSDHDEVVYRGFRPDDLPNDTSAYLEWAHESYAVGSTVELPSYTSTSHDPGFAAQWATYTYPDDPDTVYPRGVVFEIVTRRGAYLGHVSEFDTLEQERLLPRGSRMQVVGITTEPYQCHDDPDVDGHAQVVVVRMVDVTDDEPATSTGDVAA